MGLQSVLGWWVTNCDNNGLQSMLGVGLQSVEKWITKYVKDYKVWWDYKVSQYSGYILLKEIIAVANPSTADIDGKIVIKVIVIVIKAIFKNYATFGKGITESKEYRSR